MGHPYLPINVSVNGRQCLVVGGGAIAIRKIEHLIDYDAKVTVIAPEPLDRIEYYATKGLVKLERRGYESPEAASYDVVISATDDRELNKRVSEDCRKTNTLVNVVDDPELCDFTFPAVMRRDCLSVAVSSDGKAPFLSGHLRVVMDTIFPEKQWEKIAKLAADFRNQAYEKWPDDDEKRAHCFSAFLNAEWRQVFEDKKSPDEIQAMLDTMLEGKPQY